MDELTYTLQQLSDLSGVEPRTIRSYIERDLLPGPHGLGPKASYGPEHVDRLEVIRLLRDAHREITLDQIRSFLGQLTPERIAAIAAGGLKAIGSAGSDTSAGSAGSAASAGSAGSDYFDAAAELEALVRPASSALQYLHSIAGPGPAPGPPDRRPAPSRPSLRREPTRHSSPLPDRSRGRTPFEELLGVLGAALSSGTVARSVRSETWHRVPITPDIELSVRGELDADKLALLQRIGDHLRHLLMKGTRT